MDQTENLHPRRVKGLRAIARRFGRNRDGATAIEFGMLAIPFCLLLFAILESCISFAAQQVMANITDDVAREIRTTGQLRNATNTGTDPVNAANLKARVCRDLEIVVSKTCPGLVLDLRTFNTFAEAANIKLAFKDGDIDTTGFDVKSGGAMSKNMLRVFYRWPILTDLLRLQMSNLNGYKTLHFATTTWKNEPYDE